MQTTIAAFNFVAAAAAAAVGSADLRPRAPNYAGEACSDIIALIKLIVRRDSNLRY